MLALYAHVEEKHAGKIQAAFRNRRPSALASAGEIATSAGEIATSRREIAGSGSYTANYETKVSAGVWVRVRARVRVWVWARVWVRVWVGCG